MICKKESDIESFEGTSRSSCYIQYLGQFGCHHITENQRKRYFLNALQKESFFAMHTHKYTTPLRDKKEKKKKNMTEENPKIEK